jgi:UDP-N-acetylglucosamine 4,6-dehydratase
MSEYRSFSQPAPDLDGKSILITGGTGSFGRAFVQYLLTKIERKPRRIVIFSRDEQKQDTMARELKVLGDDLYRRMRFFIGDVRDVSRLELAMREVEIVVHAAALKMVPTAEYNPFECILTNVHGSENVVKAALRCGVKKVVALSTDKAANPINLYGASKLAADKIMIAANNLSGDLGSIFSVVRYGNVIGSRGSVLPLYQDLLLNGAKALPVTDPRMTRFWIALEQGVAFVGSTISTMQGGEIFVPKIASMCIADLARAVAPTIPHDIIGIRPGEKLHEVLISEDDSRWAWDLGDRYAICGPEARGYSWLKETAKPVPENFRYSSDGNSEWLDAATLVGLMKEKAA